VISNTAVHWTGDKGWDFQPAAPRTQHPQPQQPGPNLRNREGVRTRWQATCTGHKPARRLLEHCWQPSQQHVWFNLPHCSPLTPLRHRHAALLGCAAGSGIQWCHRLTSIASIASVLPILLPTPVCLLVGTGHRVVVVSSGAVGVGCQRLGVANRPTSLAQKQALAAVGQVHLMRFYEDLFNALQLVGESLLCLCWIPQSQCAILTDEPFLVGVLS
jgi:hypothetical protein